MNVNEFNILFDVLYNNITSNQAPGLNGYEKSVFLTKAQDELIKNYFLASHNTKQEGYMDTPKREYDFSDIIFNQTISETASGSTYYHNSNYCILFNMPADVFIILNEQLVQEGKTVFNIVPLDYAEFLKLMKKPYKLPLKGQVWKLQRTTSTGTGTSNFNTRNSAEFIGNIDKTKNIVYSIRYIRKLYPIILEDLTEYGVTIKGQKKPMTKEGVLIESNSYGVLSPCSLPVETHEEVLQRAVEIAKGVWLGDLDHTVQLGQRSE